MKHTHHTLQALLAFTMIVTLLLGPASGIARAQSDPLANNPDHAGVRIGCHNGVCSMDVDLGEIEINDVDLSQYPLDLAVPLGKLDFLPEGMSLDISDALSITLPFGTLQMVEGDLMARVTGEGELDRFRLTAQTLVPTFQFLNDMKIVGPFSADIGYEYGAALTDVEAPLQPDQRYVLLDLGAGFQAISTVAREDGSTERVALSVPRGQHLKIVLDPEQPLAYVEGVVTMYDLADLTAINGLLAANNIALPTDLSLPMRTALGVKGLLSGNLADSYLELTGGTAVELGVLGRLAGVEGTPLAVQGVVRLDGAGLTLTGLADASIMPDVLVDGSAGLQVFVPINAEAGAPYVRYGGDLNVPLAGIATAADATLGGAASEPAAKDATIVTATAAAPEDAAQEESSWWERAGAWVGGVTESTVAGAQAGVEAVQGAVAGGAAAAAPALEAAAPALDTAKTGAGKVIDATTTNAACASAYAEMLWCQATGFCEVKPLDCGEGN